MTYDSDIADNVYDYLFKNTDLQFIDFIAEYPYSYVDKSKATIFLAKEEGKELFKIKIEKV